MICECRMIHLTPIISYRVFLLGYDWTLLHK